LETGLNQTDHFKVNSRKENNPTFTISVRFEKGEVQSYDDVSALETDLEMFDSESSPDCEVRDALGRPTHNIST
jgi:hypothetical protein